MTALTKDDLVAAFKDLGLTGSNLKNQREGNSFSGGGTGTMATIMATVSDVLGKTANVFQQVIGVVGPQVGIFRSLAQAGLNFQGGLTELSVSASGARVSSAEFAETLSKTGVNLKGLGGSSTEATKNFSALTQTFYELPNVSDGLRNLGLSFTDLNDTMALYATISGPINLRDAKAKEAAAFAARDLAKEMDMQSRLLGVSRKEQEEVQKKIATDVAYQAKIREMTAGMNPEEAAKVREEYNKALADATYMGIAESFKEKVVYGVAGISEEARNQVNMSGELVESVSARADALSKRDYESAERLKNQSYARLEELSRDTAKLGIMSQGELNGQLRGNEAVFRKSYELSDKVTAEAIKRGETAQLQSEEYRVKLMGEIIAKEKKAQEDAMAGKNGMELTDAALKVEARARDAEAGIALGAMTKAYNALSPEVHKVATDFGILDSQFKNYKGEDSTKARVAREESSSGFDGAKKAEDAAKEKKSVFEALMFSGGQIIGTGTEWGTALIKKLDEKTKDTKTVPPEDPKIQRMNGSPGIGDFLSGGSFDKMFENFGSGTPAMLHKEEVVATKDQMAKMLAKAQGSVSSMLGGDVGGGQNEVLAILKQISTTMTQMVSQTTMVATNTSTQIRVTKNLSNNMYEA
jgi:hypothetical protein